MQPLNHPVALTTNHHLIIWNRIIRLWAVGRILLFTAAAGVLMGYWMIVSDTFGWQKSNLTSSCGVYGFLVIGTAGIVVGALLDARSRFQDYKRVKDLFFENGFRPRIAKIYMYSKCQRDAARVAAKDLGLLDQLDCFYQSQGYRWYHILPDFVFKKPWIVLSRRYWQKTLFEPQYTSTHFRW